MEITKKIEVDCLEQSKIQYPKTIAETEYNEYLINKIFLIQIERVKNIKQHLKSKNKIKWI